MHFKKNLSALAGVGQWIEHQPVNQRVTSSIPNQGTCLGCGRGPQHGASEKQPHTDVSLPPFLLPFPILKIKKKMLNLIKIGEFLCSHFNIEDGRKYATFSAYYGLLFQER